VKEKVLTEGSSGRHYSLFSMRKKFDFEMKIFSAQGIRIRTRCHKENVKRKERVLYRYLKSKKHKSILKDKPWFNFKFPKQKNLKIKRRQILSDVPANYNNFELIFRPF
jgi:hypothetical protein